MSKMFKNYDSGNCACRETYCCPEEKTKILESDPSMSLIVDAMGNEVGITARHNNPFNLYFYLDGCVQGSSIEELVYNSTIVFQIIDSAHRVVLNRELLAARDDCFCDDTIIIRINQAECAQLKQESYRMRLSLSWIGSSYELFSEHNGLLVIK